MFREGHCPTCGIQTHQLKGILSKQLKPITNDRVFQGKCQSCSSTGASSPASTARPAAHPEPSAPPIGKDNLQGLPIVTAVAVDESESKYMPAVPLTATIVAATIVPSAPSIPSTAGIRFRDGNKWGNYVGSTVRDKRWSYGTIQYEDGSSYAGEWNNDKMHGNGRFNYASGPIYEGKWKNGEMSGSGIYYYPDGKADARNYHQGECVGQGVQWNTNRSQAQLLNCGRPKKIISHGEARRIASQLGLDVPK
jgi:hypothetical protein